MFYKNLFNREPDSLGLGHWIYLLDMKVITPQQVGLRIAEEALNAPRFNQKGRFNTDKAALESKISAADQWTLATSRTRDALLAYNNQRGIDAGKQAS